VWWLAIGCGRDVFFGTETGGGDTGGGDSAIVARFERGRADLAPRLVVDVAFDASLRVSWFDEDGVRTATTDQLGDHHEVDLLGLRPDRDYVFEVTAFGARTAAQTQLGLTTDPLPAALPLSTPVAGDLNGTDTILAVSTGQGALDPDAVGAVVVVRGDGEIVWWLDPGDVVHDVFAEPSGVVVLQGAVEPVVVRYSWQGQELSRWSTSRAGATPISSPHQGPLHRNVQRTFQGLATLQWVPTTRGDLPLDYEGAAVGSRVFADEHVIVFDDDGSVVYRELASTFWPPQRLGWGSLDDTVAGSAWADASARIEDAGVLWSLTNQDAIALTESGGVEWVVGRAAELPPDVAGVTLEPSDAGPWHPTDAALLPAPFGHRLAVFDSGRYGASPPTPAVAGTTSRLAVYDLDETAGTATLRWELADLGDGPRSTARGRVSLQPDGAVLATWEAVGAPSAGHVIVADAGTGEVLRHHVLDAQGPDDARVSAAASLPPIDSWVEIVTTDLRDGSSTTTTGGGHSGG
jgi:hypothetical protein